MTIRTLPKGPINYLGFLFTCFVLHLSIAALTLISRFDIEGQILVDNVTHQIIIRYLEIRKTCEVAATRKHVDGNHIQSRYIANISLAIPNAKHS